MPFYQYPPAGSAAGSAAVPTGGLYLDWSFRVGRPANLTFVVVSGSATLQYWDDHDTPSPVISPAVGTGWHETDKIVQRLQVTGSGAIALVLNTPPQDIDIKALLAAATLSGPLTITGPVETDLGQANAGANLVTPLVPNTHLGPLDLPGDSNFTYTPVAKASQLPAALVGGGLNIRTITEPLARSWNLSASDNPKLATILGADGTDPRQIRALAVGVDGVGLYTYTGSIWRTLSSDVAGNIYAYPVVGGSPIDPRAIRALTSSDQPAILFYQPTTGTFQAPHIDSNGLVQHTQYVPGTTTPLYTAQLLQDTGGRQIQKVQGHQTIVETEGSSSSQGPGSGTLKAGTTTIPIGTMVTWVLSAGPANAISATGNVVLMLVTHAGAVPLVQALFSIYGGTASSSFFMPVADKIDVQFVQSYAVGVSATMTWSWQATNP